MRSLHRLTATAAALLAIGAVLTGCPSQVPAVNFPTEELTISLAPMVVGDAVTKTLPEAMGGKEGLVYSLVPAVPGLTFNPATRVLSGTPSAPGTHDMTYTAKDPATKGTMESVTFTITVNAKPLTILGTWQGTTKESNGVPGQTIWKVTFTPTHFFEWVEYQSADGDTLGRGSNAGKISIGETSVTKTVYDGHPEVNREISVDKDYVLSSDGNVLLIHPWDWNESTNEFRRYTRVAPATVPTGQSQTLRGTWTQTHSWYNDDARRWDTDIRTLTFNETRFIERTVSLDSVTGVHLGNRAPAGGWTDKGTSVTKTWFDDDQLASVDKAYVLAGNLLAVNPWWDDNPNKELDVFTRVAEPLPGGVTGTWVHTRTEQGSTRTWTITVGDTFVYDFRDASETWRLTGSLRHDPDNGILHVTVQTASVTENGSTPDDFDPSEYVGHELPFAYAPTESPNTIVVSRLWEEKRYDEATSTWKDRNPYGHYWLEMTRQ